MPGTANILEMNMRTHPLLMTQPIQGCVKNDGRARKDWLYANPMVHFPQGITSLEKSRKVKTIPEVLMITTVQIAPPGPPEPSCLYPGFYKHYLLYSSDFASWEPPEDTTLSLQIA